MRRVIHYEQIKTNFYRNRTYSTLVQKFFMIVILHAGPYKNVEKRYCRSAAIDRKNGVTLQALKLEIHLTGTGQKALHALSHV